MMRKLWWIAATFVVWVAVGLAQGRGLQRAQAAAGGFYCQTHIIEPGAEAYRVQAWCGPPVSMQPRLESRRQLQTVSVPCPRGYCNSVVEREVSVQVEEWIYDFGPQRFVQYLTFEQGILVRVRTGTYGVKEVRSSAGIE